MAIIGAYVNYLAVLLATVAYFILGWLWYGPLFGKPWMKEMKITKKEMTQAQKKGMAKSMITNFIATFISLYVLALLFSATNMSGIGAGMYLAVLIWLGFFATAGVSTILWEGKSLRLFLINQTYTLVGLLIAGTIIGAW